MTKWLAVSALALAACSTVVADDFPPFDLAPPDARVADGAMTDGGTDGSMADGSADGSMHDGSTCAAPNVLRYETPGCDATPVCGSPLGDLCLRLVRSCSGKVIGGCDYYREPWLPGTLDPGVYHVGGSCLPD